MLVIGIEYLTGRVVATLRSNREMPEWPPHPTRLFSAMVSTLYEFNIGEEAREALLWLEKQQPPSMWAKPVTIGEDTPTAQRSWVPVNDSNDQVGSPLSPGIPVLRKRAERFFPSFCPESPHVYFVWDKADPSEIIRFRRALEMISENMTYLGHSASLIRASILDSPPEEPNLVPDEEGEWILRVPGPGRLKRLEEHYYVSKKTGRRIEPPLGRFARYGEPRKKDRFALPSPFQVQAVFRRLKGTSMPIESGPFLARTVQKAILSLIEEPIPESLSGHTPNGEPSKRAHLAVTPLPDVGHPHADGHLLGFAVLLPKETPRAEQEILALALARLEKVWMGLNGEWLIQRCDLIPNDSLPLGLQKTNLTREGRVWQSVTPVVFGHFPKRTEGKTGEDLLARCCLEAGYPTPTLLEYGPVTTFQGVPNSRAFESAQKQISRRFLAHARLVFKEPITGPVVIGAGRFLGMGFFRSLKEEMES